MPQTILMPALSAGMEEGTIARWLKREGDSVAAGDVLAEIETDKATMEFEAERSGVLGRILAAKGETIAVNGAIALLLAEGEHSAGNESRAGVVEQVSTAQTISDPNPAPLNQAASQLVEKPRRAPSSPLARRMAQESGVALEELTGSGPRGRIVRVDIERSVESNTRASVAQPPPTPVMSAPRPGVRHAEVPLTHVRKAIAHRLTEAKASIPHFYLDAECDVGALMELRAKLNGQPNAPGKLSVNDFVIKAAALALREVPEANTAWAGDAILMFQDIDISVAVATDGGLITPIVRRADGMGLSAIASELKSLAERAREGRLQPAEYQGGTFTISNLGMYGVRAFSAIINPPQSCILAVGAAERRPVVRGDVCVPSLVMSCTLSIDHRSVDGAVGARYLAAFKKFIEQPLLLLL